MTLEDLLRFRTTAGVDPLAERGSLVSVDMNNPQHFQCRLPLPVGWHLCYAMNKSYLMTVEKWPGGACCCISSAVWELVPIVRQAQGCKDDEGTWEAASDDVAVQGNTEE